MSEIASDLGVAIGCAVIYDARVARTFSPGINCWHCTCHWLVTTYGTKSDDNRISKFLEVKNIKHIHLELFSHIWQTCSWVFHLQGSVVFLELLAWHRRISAYDAVQQRSMKEHVLILQRREHFQIKLEIRNFLKDFLQTLHVFYFIVHA